MSGGSVLDDLARALDGGTVRVVDLTAPLSEETPIIPLPADRGQPWRFARQVISHFDDAGPHVYWNNIQLSEHTGTHFDAPIHWISGRDLRRREGLTGLPLLAAPTGTIVIAGRSS